MPPGGGDRLVLGACLHWVELHLPADPRVEGTCRAALGFGALFALPIGTQVSQWLVPGL